MKTRSQNKVNESKQDATSTGTQPPDANGAGATHTPPAPPPILRVPPPTEHAPAPPQGWVEATLGRTGARLKRAQIDNCRQAGVELQSTTTYDADFGPRAPDGPALAGLMISAAKWREEWDLARRWYKYVNEQRAAWEAAVLTQTEALQPLFVYASVRDPGIARRYPSLKQFMEARSLIAKRAGRSRKKNATTSDGTNGSPTPPGHASSSTPAPPSPPASPQTH